MSRTGTWCGASGGAGIILSACIGRWPMPGPFTTIRTANRGYWREGLESKEETSCAKFRCGSRAGAAQSCEGCGKDGADAWDSLVRVGEGTGCRKEAIAPIAWFSVNDHGVGRRFGKISCYGASFAGKTGKLSRQTATNARSVVSLYLGI